MAAENTKNLGLKVYKDISGVYQRELRQSYAENFEKIDTAAKDIEDKLKAYVNEQLGVIENGSY